MKIIQILVLITLCLFVQGQEERLGANHNIFFNCSSQPKTFYFKTMQQFSIILQSLSRRLLLGADNVSCYLSQEHNTICTFLNMTKQVNISCPGIPLEAPVQADVIIKRPHVLVNQQEAKNSNLIRLSMQSGEQGVASMLLDGDFNYQAQRKNASLDGNKNMLDFFLSSDCVQNISLFGDRFKIAVKMKQNPCVIGLKNYSSDWKFFKTITKVQTNKDQYTGFLKKSVSKTYNLPDKNLIIFMIFDTEQAIHEKDISVKVQFISNNGNVTFNINNYQAGLPFFSSYLYTSEIYSMLTITSNTNTYFSMDIQFSDKQNNIMGVQDTYLYIENKKNQRDIILELDGFTDQTKNARIIQFTTSTDKSFNFTYEQCVTQTCQNFTKKSDFISTGQFVPECKHIIDDMCYLKITLENIPQQNIEILPFTKNKHTQLAVGTIHKGIIRKQNILHFVVTKEDLKVKIMVMQKTSSEVLMVSVTAAKIYLTYDPECNRIYCAEFWGESNSIEIPNQQKDLFIFIEGRTHSHYTLVINAEMQNILTLPEGLGINSILTLNENKKYFLYKPENNTKGFQINCNAIPNSILLMVNIRDKQFPEKGKSAFTSKDCYIHVGSNEFGNGDAAHITVQKIHRNSDLVNFYLLGVTQGNQIIGHWRDPFHDFFQPNSTKTFKYLISVPTDDVSFKVDVYEQINMQPIVIKFGDKNNVRYNVSIIDVKTFTIHHKQQQEICKSQTVSECYLYIEIANSGEVGLEISITSWQKSQAIKLIMGQFSNFQTGALGEETHFYVQAADLTKPISVYVFSNQVEIQVIGQLWNSNIHLPVRSWPFPSFSFIPIQQLETMVYAFSYTLQFNEQILKDGNQSAVILITVRDKSLFVNRTAEGPTNAGNIQLAISNGYLKLHEDDKFEYNVAVNETYHFEVPLGNLLQQQKQEIYFSNVPLAGSGQIAYHFINEPWNDQTANYIKDDLAIVKLDDYKRKIDYKKSKEYHSVIFVVKCIGNTSCKFLAGVISSSSEYRQLTLGIPEQFYIAPFSQTIFEFSDFYNQDFKIKVQRQQGFPYYKMISCPHNANKLQCVSPLLKRDQQSQESQLVLTGRSHQLRIDSKSDHYCKDCIYYIAFYSYETELFGSLTITRPGQVVMLQESVPLTTQLYADDEDSYILTTMNTTQRYITIIAHMGQIQVQLIQMFVAPDKKPNVHIENSTGKVGMELKLKITQTPIPYNLKLRSLDKENAMYTIILSSKHNVISLQDGVPFKKSMSPNSDFKVQYVPSGKSTILITATSPIVTKVVCHNFNKTLNQSKNIKYSEVLNLTLLHVNKQQCQNYIIELHNNKLTNVTILPNDEQIILLPFGLTIPGLVTNKKCQMYEMPIQQKTKLKIVIHICSPGHAFLGISKNKNKMFKQIYDKKFIINGDRSMEVFEYSVTPGIVYFEIHSQSESIEYNIQVFNLERQSDEVLTHIELADPYIETNAISDKKFSLNFQPYKVVNKGLSYSVSYIIVESPQRANLRKTHRCSSTFFDINNPNNTFKQSIIQTVKQSDGSLKAQYQTTFAHSYITILAVIDPPPQNYIAKPQYFITQLSVHKVKVFERLTSSVIKVIENVTGVDNQNMLNFILVFIIIVINVLLIVTCCWIANRHCRPAIVIEMKRLATTQRQGRLSRQDNNLDMLQPSPTEHTIQTPDLP